MKKLIALTLLLFSLSTLKSTLPEEVEYQLQELQTQKEVEKTHDKSTARPTSILAACREFLGPRLYFKATDVMGGDREDDDFEC